MSACVYRYFKYYSGFYYTLNGPMFIGLDKTESRMKLHILTAGKFICITFDIRWFACFDYRKSILSASKRIKATFKFQQYD